VLSDGLAEAMNQAAGLCHAEANRMESAHKPTAEHWRSIATRLHGGYLAYGAMLELASGGGDLEWDLRFAEVMIDNFALLREVDRLRGLVGQGPGTNITPEVQRVG
jgi:hypothetical protein